MIHRWFCSFHSEFLLYETSSFKHALKNKSVNFWISFPQALGVFGLCQICAFIEYVRARLSKEYFETLLKAVLMTVFSAVVVVGIILSITGKSQFTDSFSGTIWQITKYLLLFATLGKVSPWTGRFYSLLDPSYAKNHIPIIASVSEHQPTSWSSFYFDLQVSRL